MFASRVRRLRGVQPANHGILLRGLTPRASSPWHGGSAQRHYHQQQKDEWDGSKAAKVTVWWNFQRCRLPSHADPRCLVPRLTAALRRAGIRGPVDVTAFGDVTLIPRAEREALTDTGVSLSHVPHSVKDSSYQSFVPDLVSWIAQNPPPAHFLLISGDEDFAKVLHRLRMSNYNVLLSSPKNCSKMMRSAATFMWPWEPLVNGVDLVPKYLNQPPDGLSSWYGQYRGHGDDLLLKPKKHALQRSSKEPKVPKSVVHKKAGLTQRAERSSNHVEADVTLAGDVPSPPSNAPSIDQRDAAVVDLVKKAEQPVNRMEADKVDASGTPSSSGAQGSISNKRGLFERISSL